MGGFERGPERNRNIIHAIHGSWYVDPIRRHGECHGRSPRCRGFFRIKRYRRNTRQVFARWLAEICHRITGDNHSRICLATSQDVSRCVFPWIEARKTTCQVNSERITCPPRDDVVRTSYVAVSSIWFASEPSVTVHIACQRQHRFAICMFSPSHREPHAKKDDAKSGSLHPIHQVLPQRKWITRFTLHFLWIELNPLGQCT